MPDPVAQPDPKPVVVADPAAVVTDPKPVVAAADPKPSVVPDPATVVPPVEPKKDWKDGRIAELTAKVNKIAGELATERARKTEPIQTSGETPEQYEARVQEAARALAPKLAQELQAQTTWNDQCNNLVREGKTKHQDWDARLTSIKSVINGQDATEVQQYNNMLAAAIETGSGSELLYELGNDPGEFRRLMALPPVKLAVELTKRATKLSAPVADPEPSNLPKPITPVGGRGDHHEEIKPDDASRGTKLSTKEWMARRTKQVEERGLQ